LHLFERQRQLMQPIFVGSTEITGKSGPLRRRHAVSFGGHTRSAGLHSHNDVSLDEQALIRVGEEID